jgi:hypothetical protein
LLFRHLLSYLVRDQVRHPVRHVLHHFVGHLAPQFRREKLLFRHLLHHLVCDLVCHPIRHLNPNSSGTSLAHSFYALSSIDLVPIFDFVCFTFTPPPWEPTRKGKYLIINLFLPSRRY